MTNRPERSRKAVDEIFGDALPPKVIDDHDRAPTDEAEHDRWLRENTPPHHQ